jgi:tripartite ATP-independent transporter DctP family solute receptor
LVWCQGSKWLAIVALTGLLTGAPAASARDFRAADNQVEDYPTVQALIEMDRLINERTSGRHRIRVFHSSQLGEEIDTIALTRAGAIDLNRINIAPIGSFIPEANVLALPFLFRSMEHYYKVVDGPIGADVLATFEAYGFVGLTFYDSGARSVYNNVRPIKTLADLKGLRIRVQQSDLMLDMMKALGAVPVALSYGQVLTGLTTRLIDGAENNWPSYVTTNHYLAARHYSLTEHAISPEVLVMSAKSWNSLSEEERAIFRSAAQQSAQFMRRQWKAWEDRAQEQARNAGSLIITDIDRKPFMDRMSGIYDKLLTDGKMRQFVERIRSVQ